MLYYPERSKVPPTSGLSMPCTLYYNVQAGLGPLIPALHWQRQETPYGFQVHLSEKKKKNQTTKKAEAGTQEALMTQSLPHSVHHCPSYIKSCN